MTAEAIAKALGGRKAGGTWVACCPAHDDRTPSLSIRDARANRNKVLVRCHAGCDQTLVVEALRKLGLWTVNGPRGVSRVMRHSHVECVADPDELRRTKVAMTIWEATTPAEGTVVETYLASRGIHLSIPGTLRFHTRLRHASGGFWPAMVALVTNGADGIPLAIHRTFLAHDGRGKAPVGPQKMMLGPCRGGAVRLADPSDVLMLGEGIETCLAAMLASGHPAWAGLSTSGLRALILPETVREVIVLADGDKAGEAAALDCASRWKHEGRRVRIARPPRGMDFNDMLRPGASLIREGA